MDPQCVLCEHNPHRRCNVNFAPKYLVNDILKAKCDAQIRVEVIDRITGAPVTEELPELTLEVRREAVVCSFVDPPHRCAFLTATPTRPSAWRPAWSRTRSSIRARCCKTTKHRHSWLPGRAGPTAQPTRSSCRWRYVVVHLVLAAGTVRIGWFGDPAGAARFRLERGAAVGSQAPVSPAGAGCGPPWQHRCQHSSRRVGGLCGRC